MALHIDIRDNISDLSSWVPAQHDELEEWVTCIKPNMIVEHTLCFMEDIFLARIKFRSERLLKIPGNDSSRKLPIQMLEEAEPAWRNKMEKLGLDVTRWRIHPCALLNEGLDCNFYVTVSLNAPENEAVLKLLNKIGTPLDEDWDKRATKLRRGFFTTPKNPDVSISIPYAEDRYAQIIISASSWEYVDNPLDNPDVQEVLKQFNRCLSPVVEPWKADNEETLAEVFKELYNEPELGEL
jgi:hypothetical protein